MEKTYKLEKLLSVWESDTIYGGMDPRSDFDLCKNFQPFFITSKKNAAKKAEIKKIIINFNSPLLIMEGIYISPKGKKIVNITIKTDADMARLKIPGDIQKAIKSQMVMLIKFYQGDLSRKIQVLQRDITSDVIDCLEYRGKALTIFDD
jgi:hypothetical protein